MLQTRALFPVLFALTAASAFSQNAVRAGAFTVEYPTLLNLGFEWSITGDQNRNASVSLQYRATSESTWKQALPLLRMGGENVYRKSVTSAFWRRKLDPESP